MPVIAAAVMTALAAAAPAAATPHQTVARADCADAPQRDVIAARGERLGPLVFGAGWTGYAQWPNMERQRDPSDGTYYAKSGLYVSRGVVATLSIAPAYRGVADFNYGNDSNGEAVLSEVVRIRGCTRRRGFISGGLVVKGPTCVSIGVRGRGDRRVYRRMVSIDMGANCPPAT